MSAPLHHSISVPVRLLARALRNSGCVLLMASAPVSGWCQTTITAGMRWSTYLGGTADDQVLSVATDAFGHVYVAGRTSDSLHLGNDTTGRSGLTYQGTYGGGGSDAFLAKIAPHGSVLWCTYFGGEGDDEAVQVVITEMDGVYLVGHTTSADGIATDTLAHQGAHGGGQDMFVARFTEYGALLGATYFGGVDDEIASGAVLDHRGHLLVCGSTSGAGSFANDAPPVLGSSGGTDGLLLRFSTTDSLAAGTFIGGEGDDALVQLSTGDSSGVVLAGHTTSTTGIAVGTAFSPSAPGNGDGFIMQADTNLSVVQGTYFGGGAEDHIHGLARFGALIAICGISYSDTLYADTAAYQQTNAGGGDGFFAILVPELQLNAFTFYGDTAFDALTAVAFDSTATCYAVGTTGSSMLATTSGEGSTFQGTTDAWVIRFDSLFVPQWSRYVGATQADEAHALSIMGITSVIVGGRTASQDQFTMVGHQMDFGGGTWDGCALWLDQEFSTPCTGICTPVTTTTGTNSGSGYCNGVSQPLPVWDVCLGDSVTFIAYGGALGMGAEWMWYADGCGQPEHFLTSGDTITFAPTASLLLSVRAESANNTSACKHLPIVVHAWPEPIVAVSDTVCVGDMIAMEGIGAETFTWNLMDTLLTGDQAELAAMEVGNHVLEVTATNGPACSVVLEETIVVLPPPVAMWQVTDILCSGGADGAISLVGPTADLTILWSSTGLEGPFLSDLNEGTYIATLTDTAGCTSTDTLLIHMPAVLIDSVSTTDALCGDPTGSALVHTGSSDTGLMFDWGEGFSTTPSAESLLPGSYTVIATNDPGCSQQVDFSIAATGDLLVSIGPDTVLAENGIAILHCTTVPYDGLANFQWSPTMGLDAPFTASTTCTISDTVTYVVVVTSSQGCTNSDSVVVVPSFTLPTVTPDPCGEAFLPDIFSPNGDGLNDALCVLGGCFTSLSLNIYDRWGQRVFAAGTENSCWDGTHSGVPLPAGGYAVTLTAERSSGEVVEHTGIVTLKR